LSGKKVDTPRRDRFYYEKKAVSDGYSVVAGIDEAGRGPLAGPVVAAAVVVRDTGFVEKIDDSKKLSAGKREKAYLDILKRCDVGIGMSDVEEIDRGNILNATLSAMKRAVEELETRPDYLLIDGRMELDLPQRKICLIGGEMLSLSIACASIIAKVFRDRIMMDEDKRYPQYGFAKHKGYGTRNHIEAIREHGLSRFHRKTFGPFGGRGAFKAR
jgi:ribonuclease HII